MNWVTIYIKGRTDFRPEVRKKLEHSKLNFMPGYTDHSLGRGAHDLYWLDENITLKVFKEAIGAKLIWKYRLRFYTNLEGFIHAQNEKRLRSIQEGDDRDFNEMMKRFSKSA